MHLQPDPDRDGQQNDRDQERNAPAPGCERRDLGTGRRRHLGKVGVDVDLREHDDDEGEQETECRGGLDPAGEEAAFVGRRVLRDIDRRAAILAAERETLGHAQRNERDRRHEPDRLVARQAADQEGGRTHDQDGDEKGVLAANQIAQPAEHQRAERPHQEARGKGQQREDVARRLGVLAEELRADNRGQRAVEVEVVPFENGTKRRRKNDPLLFAAHRAASYRCISYCCLDRHALVPL